MLMVMINKMKLLVLAILLVWNIAGFTRAGYEPRVQHPGSFMDSALKNMKTAKQIEFFLIPEQLICQSGIRITSTFIDQSSHHQTNCDVGEVCSIASSHFSIRIGRNLASGKIEVSKCLPSSSCHLRSCEIIKIYVPTAISKTLYNCTIQCCNESLCNKEGVRQSSRNFITTPQVTPVERPVTPVERPVHPVNNAGIFRRNHSQPWMTTAAVPCNLNLSATSVAQLFSWRGWPKRSSQVRQCSWKITVTSDDSFVQLNFLGFSSEIGQLTLKEGEYFYENIWGNTGFIPSIVSSSDHVTLVFGPDQEDNMEAILQISFLEIEYLMTRNVLSRIRSFNPPLNSSYPNWFAYKYDGGKNSIRDGGKDMFDLGNLIHLELDQSEEFPVLYDRTYRFNGFEFTSHAGDPFVWILWVDDESSERSLVIKIRGDPGSDGKGKAETLSGNITFDRYCLKYDVFQLSGTDDPTICETHFIISNTQKWNSTSNALPLVTFNGNARLLSTEVRILAGENRFKNSIVGYILLSRFPSIRISRDEIETVLRRILQSFTSGENNTATNESQQDADCYEQRGKSAIGELRPTPIRINSDNALSEMAEEIDVIIEAERQTWNSADGQQVGFLSNCSVRQFVGSLLSCEEELSKLSANSATHKICEKNIVNVIKCMGRKLMQCSFGDSNNFLDRFNFQFLNSKILMRTVKNLTENEDGNVNSKIVSFCFHVVERISHPHSFSNFLPFCDDGTQELFLEQFSTFLYTVIWSRDRNDICTSFRDLKSWFLQMFQQRCDPFFYLNENIYSQLSSSYLTSLLNEAIQAVEGFAVESCPGEMRSTRV